MGKKNYYKKSDGTKTVTQGGRIVGNLPSGRSTNPVSGDDLARAKGPTDTSLTAGMSAEQVNSIYDGFAARKEAERLAEERRPLVEAMLQEDRAAREQAKNEQRQRDQRKCFNSFQSIPESERPELSPGDLDLLKKDERVRYVAGNGTHTAQSAQVVGYLMLRARHRTPDLSPQEVVSDAVSNVRANRGASGGVRKEIDDRSPLALAGEEPLGGTPQERAARSDGAFSTIEHEPWAKPLHKRAVDKILADDVRFNSSEITEMLRAEGVEGDSEKGSRLIVGYLLERGTNSRWREPRNAYQVYNGALVYPHPPRFGLIHPGRG